MEDDLIIADLVSRRDGAIQDLSEKYGKYCHSIAFAILRSHEDAEEIVSDTLLRAWNAIPPDQPRILSAYLGKIARNLAFDRYRRGRTEKRGNGEMPLILDELHSVVPDQSVSSIEESVCLSDLLDRFLKTLSPEARMIFLRRYWFADPVSVIARRFSRSEASVKTSLFRSREKLKVFLTKEGVSS